MLTGRLRYYRDDIERGLERYDQLRRPATAEIVLSNREQGPEVALQLVEDRAPESFSKLDDVEAVGSGNITAETKVETADDIK